MIAQAADHHERLRFLERGGGDDPWRQRGARMVDELRMLARSVRARVRAGVPVRSQVGRLADAAQALGMEGHVQPSDPRLDPAPAADVLRAVEAARAARRPSPMQLAVLVVELVEDIALLSPSERHEVWRQLLVACEQLRAATA